MIAAGQLSYPAEPRAASSALVERLPVGRLVLAASVAVLHLAPLGTLDSAAVMYLVLAVVILFGVPHGALDGEIARPRLRPRFGHAWFIVFAIPYLGLATGVLLAWRSAPTATLAAFLAASVWHFGAEDADGDRLTATARGGVAVALPVLLHPAATTRFLGTVSLTAMPHLPAWLVSASWLWCAVALCWAVRAARRADGSGLADAVLAALPFVILPPLPAFAAYFVCLHAPQHMRGLVRAGHAPRVRSMQDAVWRSLPVTALTLLIGAGLWRWFPGAPPDRLLALTIQGLAALTLPHMLLEAAVARMPPVGTISAYRRRTVRLGFQATE